MGKNKKGTAGKTLYYFWLATKRYKGLALGAFILTPIVIVIRSALIPLVMSNMIGVVSEGLPQEELVATILPMAGKLMFLYVISSFVLEKLRTFCAWRLELRVMYDLSSQVFDVISAQSMQFHSDISLRRTALYLQQPFLRQHKQLHLQQTSVYLQQ